MDNPLNIIKWRLPDTGQTLCYNATISVACTGISGAFPQQDADLVDTPAPRGYTGPSQHSIFSNDYTTQDNTTGLVWKSCTEGLSGSSCASGTAQSYDWLSALAQCTTLNNVNGGHGYAGWTNWRLPSISELESLPDLSIINPAITGAAFPMTISGNYWSVNTDVSNTSQAFFVGFAFGNANLSNKGTTNYVRCVTDGMSTGMNGILVDRGDGTILDQRTNLLWTKCSMDNSGTGTVQEYASNCANLAAGTRTWAEALQDCNNLTLIGKVWRIPSKIE